MKKNEQSHRKTSDTNNHTDICVMRVAEKEERKDQKKYSKK